MSQHLHPDFVRDLDAYSRALLRRESLLTRIEARCLSAADAAADRDPHTDPTRPTSIER